eukprot:scaffold6200_cov118-Cylindrotheca_fusiformis.AAC.2
MNTAEFVQPQGAAQAVAEAAAAATASNERRSSSASHFSKNYREAFIVNDGSVWKFHGIPVMNDITGADITDLVGLSILILVLMFKKRLFPKVNKENPISIWIAALCVSIPLYQVIWVPFLATALMTRVSYQHLICISHCIVACCCYRSEVEQRSISHKKQLLSDSGDESSTATTGTTPTRSFPSTFGLSFVTWGFGGSLLSDVLMGLPITAVAHTRIVPSFILGYFVVWYSPYDCVYRTFNDDKSSLLFTFLNLIEAIDGVTTPMGRVSRSARELQNKMSAPLTAGMLVGVGGAIIRYFERVIVQGREEQEHASSLAALQAGIWRNLFYCILWWYLAVYRCLPKDSGDDFTVTVDLEKADHCRSFDGSDDVRFIIVLTYSIWTILCQWGVVRRHPFVWFAEVVIVPTWSRLVTILNLGPEAQPSSSSSFIESSSPVNGVHHNNLKEKEH